MLVDSGEGGIASLKRRTASVSLFFFESGTTHSHPPMLPNIPNLVGIPPTSGVKKPPAFDGPFDKGLSCFRAKFAISDVEPLDTGFGDRVGCRLVRVDAVL
jgi:hypothetical protein